MDSVKADNFVELVLTYVVPSLSAQLEERRAQMCTEVCTTITMTANALQERFEPLTGPLLTSLFKLTVVTIKIIADAAHNCILSFVKFVDSSIPLVAQGSFIFCDQLTDLNRNFRSSQNFTCKMC